MHWAFHADELKAGSRDRELRAIVLWVLGSLEQNQDGRICWCWPAAGECSHWRQEIEGVRMQRSLEMRKMSEAL